MLAFSDPLNDIAFNVLVAVTDDSLAHEIVQRIREDLSAIPVEIETETSARRLLTAFRLKQHEVVILSSTLTGAQPEALVAEIRRVSGSAIVLLLGTQPKQDAAKDIGVEWLRLPIVNWTEFLEKVRGGIPETLWSRLGLKKRESALYQTLVDYGRIFLEPGGYIAELPVQVSYIPRHFIVEDASPAAPAGTVPAPGAATPARDSSQPVYLELSWEQQRRVMRIEAVVLAGLLGVTAALFLTASPESSERWLSIRNALAAITALSFAGFFAGRSLDRYLISKSKETT